MKRYCYNFTPFDLHVLNTPPAFVLSQNQTLRKKRMRLPFQAIVKLTVRLPDPKTLLPDTARIFRAQHTI